MIDPVHPSLMLFRIFAVKEGGKLRETEPTNAHAGHASNYARQRRESKRTI